MEDVDNIFAKGLNCHQRGDYANAKKFYEQILTLNPRHFGALYLSGAIAHEESNLDQSKIYLQQAIEVNQAHIEANFNLAVIFEKLHEYDSALSQYEKLLSISPHHLQGLFNKAVLHAKLENKLEAAIGFRQVLDLNPDFLEAQKNYELIQKELASNTKQSDQDLIHFTELHQSGLSLCESKQYKLSIEKFEHALKIKPDSAEAMHNLGMVYEKIGDFSIAKNYYENALQHLPNSAPTHNNLGNVLRELNFLETATYHFEKAIELNPTYAEAYSNLGWTLYRMHLYERAMNNFEMAILHNPKLDAARFNLSLCQLTLGDFESGWKNYEYRKSQPSYHNINQQLKSPQWDGLEPISGKVVFIFAEQGLGDTLQFCRYIKNLAEKGATVAFQPQAQLLRVLKNLAGVAAFISPGQSIPPHDFHCPLMSLPFAFKTNSKTIPNATPYLTAEEDKKIYWQNMLSKIKKPKIGLVWSGGFRPDQPEIWGVNKRRNILLDEISQIQLNHLHFISLQKGMEAEEELQHRQNDLWPNENFSNFNDELKDFSDTAALITQLDLVISVDTSTAHLAAALGRPVWILNRFDSCWRWGQSSSHSDWYPTVKLYRQLQDGDWTTLIREVKIDLQQHFE